MRIIDAFTFFDELDLLEIRLNILNEKVDFFLLVEATETFSGVSKPLYFLENANRFSCWKDKIIHLVVDDYPRDNLIYQFALNSNNTGYKKEHWWVREFYQKESLIKGLENFDEEDIVFVSDLDEIWNPNLLIEVIDGEVYRPIQEAYHFFLNNRTNQSPDNWTGTRFSNLRTLRKYGPNHIRTELYAKSVPIQNGGWHFTFMGGEQGVKSKIKSYQHPEYAFKKLRRFKSWLDDSNLPKYLLENKAQWPHLFTKLPAQNKPTSLTKINRFFDLIFRANKR
jgi:beta-1,4-mannosyl-glycoprotein beta-1,4-N-acetylglucosaminyltransferase